LASILFVLPFVNDYHAAAPRRKCRYLQYAQNEDDNNTFGAGVLTNVSGLDQSVLHRHFLVDPGFPAVLVIFKELQQIIMADALTLLRGYVDSNGPQKEINLEDDDPELTFLTAELLNQRASAHSGSNRLSVGRSTDSTSENPGLLALLHQARQDDIGGSLFQVLSELNSELQLCAGAGERLSYDQYCVLRSRVSKRLRRYIL
jgi:hypothetical protein